jgi:hypothetical protein
MLLVKAFILDPNLDPTSLKTSVAYPDPHHLAGSGILEADPDPRLQNWHLINLFSVKK